MSLIRKHGAVLQAWACLALVCAGVRLDHLIVSRFTWIVRTGAGGCFICHIPIIIMPKALKQVVIAAADIDQFISLFSGIIEVFIVTFDFQLS